MTDSFNDHFTAVAAQYADYRPTYPPALFDWLASECTAHGLAWDCGAGSGQAALALTAHFQRVIATDASAAQIARATGHARIDYRVATAESSGLDNHCADLVVIAQALHWFDLERYYAETARVLKPDGLIAAWTYGVLQLDSAELNAIAGHLYSVELGPYWPPQRKLVEQGYRDLDFPFRRITAPAFSMRADWTLQQLLGYFRSWSATSRFIKTHGYDPVDAVDARLRIHWGDADRRRTVTWPLSLLAGRRFPA
ncbi:MAG TPA: class I SAM-dependent methyltransferase [Gammaproteobacteria bacterium]